MVCACSGMRASSACVQTARGDAPLAGADGLGEPRRGLAGGRRERDAQLRVERQQQRQDLDDGGGLAGAGAAGDDGEAARDGDGGGEALPVRLRVVGVRGEELPEPIREQRLVQPRDGPHARRQGGGDVGLEAPILAEIEPRAVQHERRRVARLPDPGAGAKPGEPVRERRRHGRVRGAVLARKERGAGVLGEVHADVALQVARAHQRGGQRHRAVLGDTGTAGDEAREVPGQRRQPARFHQQGQAHRGAPPWSAQRNTRSSSAPIRAASGRVQKTPRAGPVSGRMPRRKR
jgi:hypothetical protein